jgi:hypothetical protein
MLTNDAEWLMAQTRAQIDGFASEKARQPSAKQHRHQSNLVIQAAKKRRTRLDAATPLDAQSLPPTFGLRDAWMY